MNRNRFIIIAITVIAFFLIFNPLKWFRRDQGQVSYGPIDRSLTGSLKSYLEANYRSPVDFVISQFADHDVVFLGEFNKIKQHVELAKALIPALYRSGVTVMGLEYALASDQARLDALLTAPSYDERAARGIYFDWVVTWGFREYVDLLKAAWEFNRSLPAGAAPFRMLALNVKQHFEHIATEKDLQDTAKLKQVLADGIPDVFMAQTIIREAVDKGSKILVYTNLQHAFTRYRSKEYEKNMLDKGFTEVRRTGNIVYEKIGSRAITLCLDSPWIDRNAQTGLAYPVDGVLDELVQQLPAERQSFGFSTRGTPFGSLPIKSGVYTFGYEKLTLEDLCDGYIVKGRLASYEAVTPIPDFIDESNLKVATAEFPGPKEKDVTVVRMNEYIRLDTEALTKALAQFR